MAIPISTQDKLEYIFYPVSSGQVQFRVKAGHDAHIALTSGPAVGDPMYEIFLGGWGNSKSVIRKNRSQPDVAELSTPDILNENELRGFWIRWDSGAILVGKEGESAAFLVYTDPAPFGISYFGVCTGWGATGEWLIEDPTASAPPAQLQARSMGNAVWVDASSGVVPPGAIEGGRDDETLYVGRAHHEGALLPGKVKPGHAVCYVPWGGAEHGKPDYQVLCGSNTSWAQGDGGNIPPNAVPGGESEDGEPLFIGRVNHEGTITVGKVQPSHGVLYIPFGGEEVSFPQYDILVSH